MKVKTYNQQGTVTGEMELNPAVFSVEPNALLMHQVVVALQANKRTSIAHVKIRGEVRGGGAKPWRQKGTGRARHGSSRSPLWVGGAVTFGPRKDRNFSKRLNKKMKTKALYMALSDKAMHEHLLVFDQLALPEPKTKLVAQFLAGEPIKNRKALIVLPKTDTNFLRAAKNLPKVKVMRADSLSIPDLLSYELLVLPKESVKVIEKTYLRNADEAKSTSQKATA